MKKELQKTIKLSSYLVLTVMLCLSLKKGNAANHTIDFNGTTFSPSQLSVAVGDIIVWQWTAGGTNVSSVSVPAGATPWTGALVCWATTYSYEVKVAGNYTYKNSTNTEISGFTAGSSAGINQNLNVENTQISLSPNPVRDKITIHFSSNESAKGEIAIYDLLGNQIYLQNLLVSQGKNEYYIDASKFSNGLYIAQLNITGANVETYKFTKAED